ncbi:hypothetical protein D3C76_1279560 [compost metagenome]
MADFSFSVGRSTGEVGWPILAPRTRAEKSEDHENYVVGSLQASDCCACLALGGFRRLLYHVNIGAEDVVQALSPINIPALSP